MSDLNDIGNSLPTALNAAQGGDTAGALTGGGSDLPFGVARNVAEFGAITCNDVRLAAVAEAALVSVVVVHEINLPAMCQLVFDIEDSGDPWLKKGLDTFEPGAILKIPGTPAAQLIFAPMYISAVSIDAIAEPGSRSTITVTAFDKLHALRSGAYTKAFVEQSDASIFDSVASLASMRVSPSGLDARTHPYVLQDSESGYEFLMRRCRQANYECMVGWENGQETLFVRGNVTPPPPKLSEPSGAAARSTPSAPPEPPQPRPQGPRLAYKQQIKTIKLDMRESASAASVAACGYSVSGGQWPKGDSGSPSTEGEAGGGSAVQGANGGAPAPATVTLRRPDLDDTAALNFAAAAELAYLQDAFIEGTATLETVNVHAMAGMSIKLEGTNSLFDGPYLVVKSEHRFDRHGNGTILTLRRSGT